MTEAVEVVRWEDDRPVVRWDEVARAMNVVARGFGPVEGRWEDDRPVEALCVLHDLIEALSRPRCDHERGVPYAGNGAGAQAERACTNCDEPFSPKNATIRWCPKCARAGRAAAAMGWTTDSPYWPEEGADAPA